MIAAKNGRKFEKIDILFISSIYYMYCAIVGALFRGEWGGASKIFLVSGGSKSIGDGI